MGFRNGVRDEAVITVKKSELLTALKKNRDGHREIFLEAQEAYKKTVIKELEAQLKRARDGSPGAVAIHLIAPQDHTKDYDRIIKMMEMSISDTFEITESKFQEYVLDDWDWKGTFIESARNYTGKSY